MRFGVREICNVVLKAKNTMKVGNKIFYKDEPVIYFDTLKTSSMEGASATVYAQGGRGNARLVSWDGDRTVTWTMEDALISAEGFMILSGAGLVEPKPGQTLKQHMTETIDKSLTEIDDEGNFTVKLSNKPYLPHEEEKAGLHANHIHTGDYAYVMFVKDGSIVSEPYIPVHEDVPETDGYYVITVADHRNYNPACWEMWPAKLDENGEPVVDPDTGKYVPDKDKESKIISDKEYNGLSRKEQGLCEEVEAIEDGAHKYLIDGDFPAYDSVIVDYYVERDSHIKQLEITPDKFGGNYYLEADTLFRDESGADHPAEFIIPNCRVQSNFTFSMAATGDPSTFTFTMDSFPDYTRFDHSKKVLAAIQVLDDASSMDLHRHSTVHEVAHDSLDF